MSWLIPDAVMDEVDRKNMRLEPPDVETSGEFQDFEDAFYHSAVSFASPGYGDIVMSRRCRLLGAMEAANGVLMFSLSASTILSFMNRVFASHSAVHPTGAGGR